LSLLLEWSFLRAGLILFATDSPVYGSVSCMK
jgi:hypothetical protein